jgi:hypothetical protein
MLVKDDLLSWPGKLPGPSGCTIGPGRRSPAAEPQLVAKGNTVGLAGNSRVPYVISDKSFATIKLSVLWRALHSRGLKSREVAALALLRNFGL